MELQSAELLFPSPVFKFKVPNSETLNPLLLGLAHKMREESEGVNKSNRLGWHSGGNLWNTNAPPVLQLREHVLEAIRQSMGRIGTGMNPEDYRLSLNGWMNLNPTHGYNSPHLHPGNQWSGVYYVSQPEIEEGDSGKIEFIDPRGDIQLMRILKSNVFNNKIRFRPDPGDLIVFPSYLWHWVHPNESDEERMSIAWNAHFTPVKKD